MDFSYDEEQRTVRDLARTVFAGAADRLAATEASTDRIDRTTWTALAETGLTGLAIPEAHGGGGLGPAATIPLFEEQGEHTALVPLWPHVFAAWAIGEFGDEALRGELLPGAADGTTILTVALEEGGGAERTAPRLRADRTGDGWSLHGTKLAVPSVHLATAVVVSAHTDDGPVLVVVDPAESVHQDGESVHQDGDTVHQDGESTTHERCATLVFDGTPARALAAPGSGGAEALAGWCALAVSALALGVGEASVRRTVEHLNARTQFGRPLATFQAVAHQLADSHIDLEAMRVTLWQAVGRAADGEPDAASAIAIAKWWAADAGQRVVHRTQHLHGGIGVDIGYPQHRYLLWGKQLAVTLGGASAELAHLGRLVAEGRVVAV
ncbi:acyl-CoA dehydrogenase [Rhodococcus rhodnii]|uniref:Acyl-CoA dehydrogenase n=2 Tax=Rhodococcus rhodnii TaxID=38312 RepID=R7WTM9_9NOCA|nr:acyl-CoA dehydrogenase family protein [Rhodococcus rhodnii]EOM77499.1 acyl-CoA dehydrogenase [Rhodococcus rhodnii LMG 5362]TXG90367.1 acyl-CoA dehydrogenase [Rhodococcus rhodnii]